MTTGIRIFNEQRIIVLDSTKQTPLLMGETVIQVITGENMTVPMPDFLNNDSNHIIALIRITDSNSETHGYIKTISNQSVQLVFQASKYIVRNSSVNRLPANGNFSITFYRW